MAIANTTIRIKKSVISGNVPSTLANGEIAINSADGKLYYSTPTGSLAYITNTNSFATINASSTLILATSQTDTLGFSGNNGVYVTGNSTSKSISIGLVAPGTSGNVLTSNGTTWISVSPVGGVGTGTVTNVSFTGGLISVGTPTSTPALTVAGTSGGITYFSSASTWASSAALTANALMIGGGTGVAPSTITTGTGVVTALGVAVGSAGAFVTNGGALGTPSSGTVTNLTGTASININGTVGATTANTGAFTNLAYTGTLTGSTGILNIGSGQVYKDASGNVGIGTGSPLVVTNQTSVNVNGTSASRYELLVGGTRTSYVYTDASTMQIGSISTIPVLFNTNSIERMRIDSSGSVGIGTSSPSNKLDVVGDNTYSAQRASSTAQVGGGVWSMASTYWSTPTYTGTGIQQFGSTATGTTVGLANANLGVLVFQNGSAGLIYNNSTSPLVFGTASSERMRIDSSGSVGIGTSSPTSKLTVGTPFAQSPGITASFSSATPTFASGQGTVSIGSTDAVAVDKGGVLTFNANTTPLSGFPVSAIAGKVEAVGAGIYSGYLQFITSSSAGATLERMRIDSSGNMGIGTSSPGAKLQVTSATNIVGIINSTSATNTSLLTFTDPSTTLSSGLGPVIGSAGNNLIFGRGGVSEYMRIDSSGNVGIGTSSPACKLNVYSSTAQNDAIGFVQIESSIAAAGVNASYTAKNYSGTSQFMQWEHYGLRIGSRIITNGGLGNIVFTTGNDAESMRIDSSGNLLVGTTSATAAPNNGAQLIGGSIGALSVGHASGTATGNYFASFAYAGTVIGSITQSLTTGVLYNISSDQRLKTNIQPAGSAIQSILDFPVDQFDWISDSSHQDFGGVAQKILKVIPEMVSVPENPEEMMGVDWSKAVPRLIKTIQELKAIIDTQNTRIEALETK